MSIICVIYTKDMIIMSSDSRLTASKTINGVEKIRTADRLPKTFLFKDINVGISYCGNVEVNGQLFHDFIKEFKEQNITMQDNVISVAEKICNIKNREGTSFFVAGCVGDKPYVFRIKNNEKEQLNLENGQETYNLKLFGVPHATEAYKKSKYGDNVDYCNLRLKEGLEIAEDLIAYAIQNEETCGAPINTLALGIGVSGWNKMHFCNVQQL